MRAAEPADDSARSALASGVHCRADDSRISEEIAHGVGAAGADGRCGSDSTRFALASGVHCWADDSLLQLSLSSVNRDRQRGMRDRPEGRRLGSSDLFRASVGLYGGFLTVARLCMPSRPAGGRQCCIVVRSRVAPRRSSGPRFSSLPPEGWSWVGDAMYCKPHGDVVFKAILGKDESRTPEQ